MCASWKTPNSKYEWCRSDEIRDNGGLNTFENVLKLQRSIKFAYEFPPSYCHRPECSQDLSVIFRALTQTLQCLHGYFLLVVLSQGNKVFATTAKTTAYYNILKRRLAREILNNRQFFIGSMKIAFYFLFCLFHKKIIIQKCICKMQSSRAKASVNLNLV